MGLGNGAHQCKAKARTALPSGAGVIYTKEWLKNPLAVCLRNAGSLVSDLKTDQSAAILSTDLDLSACGTAFNGILHQIEQCAMQHLSIPL